MADAYSFDIEAVSRHVPWSGVFAFLGVDFTGSTFLMHARAVKDSTGTPVIDASTGLTIVYTGTATVAAHIAAGRLTADIYGLDNPATGAKYVDADPVLLSQLQIKLSTVMLEAVPEPTPLGGDVPLWYDVVRTPSIGDKELILRG